MWDPLLLALGAGLTIPIGALISEHTRFRSYCHRNELHSFVSYFGGGALLAAIALVLIPHGMKADPVGTVALSFLAGGIIFWLLDQWMAQKVSTASQFMGMLLDFIPESIALGGAAATGSNTAVLLAVMIALQNMPEGFASFQEMIKGGSSRKKLWPVFLIAPVVGPLSAWIGYAFLSNAPQLLGGLMLFCSGGILYLIFQDIAPGAHLKTRSLPALGSLLGFVLGMVGTMILH